MKDDARAIWRKLGNGNTGAGEMMAAGFVGADGRQGPPFWIPVDLVGRIPQPPPGWTYAKDGYSFLNDAIKAAGGWRTY